MADVAPFGCRVPYQSFLVFINENEFVQAPDRTVCGVVDSLFQDQQALRKLLAAQQKAAEDLLWHIPGSRVGANLIEDALRIARERGPGAEAQKARTAAA